MIHITEAQRALLCNTVSNAELYLEQDDIASILLKLDDVIIEKGMEANDDLNPLGLKLQQLSDEILDQN